MTFGILVTLASLFVVCVTGVLLCLALILLLGSVYLIVWAIGLIMERREQPNEAVVHIYGQRREATGRLE